MAKMKYDSWGESFEHGPGRRTVHKRPAQEIYLAPELEMDPELAEWDNDEFYETEVTPVYADEAHEALNRLHQKTNKRGKLMRQPRRAESWE